MSRVVVGLKASGICLVQSIEGQALITQSINDQALYCLIDRRPSLIRRTKNKMPHTLYFTYMV